MKEQSEGQAPLPSGEGGPKGRVRASKPRHHPIESHVLDHARQMRHEDTRAEKRAWVLLRDRRMLGLKFKRQVPIENFIVDFYCHDLRLIIEIDGSVHADPEKIKRDEIRSARLKELGYQILRVPNATVLREPDLFKELIRPYTPSPGPSGHPLPEGEGTRPKH